VDGDRQRILFIIESVCNCADIKEKGRIEERRWEREVTYIHIHFITHTISSGMGSWKSGKGDRAAIPQTESLLISEFTFLYVL